MNLPFKCYSIKKLLMTLTMLLAYSTSGFAVWQLPATNLTTFADSLDMAADANGHAVTVFSTGRVFASYYTNGAWSPNQPISTFTDGDYRVAVDMDATGNALAVWYSRTDSSIESASFVGGFWGIPIPNPIENNIVNITEVDVAMNGSGQGVAIWADDSGNMRSSFFSGGVWSSPETIGTGGEDISIAYSSNGTVVAGWYDGGLATVANYIGGSWQAPVVLDPAIEYMGDVGIDANGNALAIWQTSTLSALASYFNGTTWLPPVTVFPDPVPLTDVIPSLAMSPSGQAIAAWLTSTGAGVSSSFNGTSWSAPIQFTPGPITNLDVSINPTTNAGLVVWATDILTIFSSKLPLGGVWGPQEFVGADESEFCNVFTLVSDSSANGTDFASWVRGCPNPESLRFAYAIATLAPSPPLGVSATTCTNRFASQTDRVNIITWTDSPDPLVVSYELRRNGVLIATIPSGGPFIYADHNRCRNVPDVYTLTAIDVTGSPSAAVTITVQ